MFGRFGFAELVLMPLSLAIPALILYFITKAAVKKTIKELKEEEMR